MNKYKYLALSLILPAASYAQEVATETATTVADAATNNSASDLQMGWIDFFVFLGCLIPALFVAKPLGWIVGVIPWDGQRAVGKGCGTLLVWPAIAGVMLMFIKEYFGF